MAQVRQSNPQAFAQLDLKLKALEKMQTRVGWFDSAKYEDGTPVAKIVAIQEFGAGPIPPRPFMRPAVAENTPKWRDIAAQVAKRVIDGGMSAFDAMETLGIVAQGDVEQAIVNVNSPPLSILTLLARKYRMLNGRKISGGAELGALAASMRRGPPDLSGVSTKPLNDTGHMIATVTHITESTP